jgi:hypothetical protein
MLFYKLPGGEGVYGAVEEVRAWVPGFWHIGRPKRDSAGTINVPVPHSVQQYNLTWACPYPYPTPMIVLHNVTHAWPNRVGVATHRATAPASHRTTTPYYTATGARAATEMVHVGALTLPKAIQGHAV